LGNGQNEANSLSLLTSAATGKKNGWHGRIYQLTFLLLFTDDGLSGSEPSWGPSTDTHVHTSQTNIVLITGMSRGRRFNRRRGFAGGLSNKSATILLVWLHLNNIQQHQPVSKSTALQHP
jgi:hypothetical protein